jgi:hypothetical protein
MLVSRRLKATPNPSESARPPAASHKESELMRLSLLEERAED